ncbi:hypothetical protein Patl1_18738 [Pistacia atlantica]|uniref:Uncharacterized protein n=1 Tax=Pistacia atlantica TaxID=434234 RepID=A0ACC1C056_9ROSI|nr:hypothetical protein Patl1_18738 [Pistacia atlantica]
MSSKLAEVERNSSVASGQGTEPKWNENFSFTISDGTTELKLRILDSDLATCDDIVGEATLLAGFLWSLVFMKGSLQPTAYNVVKDKTFHGEIRLGLGFKPEERRERGYEENFGGWRESSQFTLPLNYY